MEKGNQSCHEHQVAWSSNDVPLQETSCSFTWNAPGEKDTMDFGGSALPTRFMQVARYGPVASCRMVFYGEAQCC